MTSDQLKSYIERVERLEGEKKELSSDIKDVYAEMKSSGYDPKIVKKIVSLRKKNKAERENEEALLDTYINALGGL